MGICAPALSFLSLAHKDNLFKNKNSVVELGAQEINKNFLSMAYDFPFDKPIDNRPLRANEKLENISVPELYHRLGFKEYEAIDANGLFNAHVLDLNSDIFSETQFRKQYDVVTNFGTTEHCFNQNNAFKNAHNLCKQDGLMIGIVPFQGNVNHGFFNYQPLFFKDLATANGYELVGLYWSFVTRDFYPRCVLPYDDNMIKLVKEKVFQKEISYVPHLSYEEICYVLRKTSDASFKVPYQGNWLGESKLKDNYSGTALLNNSFTARKSFDDINKSSEEILNEYLELYDHSLKNRLKRFNKLTASEKIKKIKGSLAARLRINNS